MPKSGRSRVELSPSDADKRKGSKTNLQSKSEQNVKILKSTNSGEPKMKKVSSRVRRNMERVEMLARPTARRLRSLWDEKCAILPRERRDKIKSALEEDYFLSPEQTEQYFQALNESSKRWSGPGGMVTRKEQVEKSKELRQRQKWLVNFSAQASRVIKHYSEACACSIEEPSDLASFIFGRVDSEYEVAYRMCDYIAKGQKEMLVSNRLRSIADVVLERVAEILGEPKPSRTHPGRLARFMVAISDRIAVWIENAVYRADAFEPRESSSDQHIRLDKEKPLEC